MAGYHGYFLWHELMSSDPDGARAFYPAVIGWTLTPGGIPNMEYDMWTTARGPVGGVMELPQESRDMGATTHWIPYMGTKDIAATSKRASELGAKTYVPVTDIPGIGQFSVHADPQGATFAMYQPASAGDGDAKPQPGDFSWHELATSDASAALNFYGELFGWTVTDKHDMGAMGIYNLFGCDGRTFGGIFNRPAAWPGAPSWTCYVRVADIDAVTAAVSEEGGRVLNGPLEVPGGDMITQCIDPQGGSFALHQMR